MHHLNYCATKHTLPNMMLTSFPWQNFSPTIPWLCSSISRHLTGSCQFQIPWHFQTTGQWSPCLPQTFWMEPASTLHAYNAVQIQQKLVQLRHTTSMWNRTEQCLRLLHMLGTVTPMYIIIENRLSVCWLSPLKRRDVRRRNFACGRAPCVCNIWAGSYVDRGHRWEENENFINLHLHFCCGGSKPAAICCYA